MASQGGSKRSKASKSRPPATSAISQPVVQDSSTLNSLSAFSPDGHYFAFLSLAVDKHRLRVYRTDTSQSVAEHIVDSARVTSLVWGKSLAGSADADGVEQPAKKKKRRKSSSRNDNAEVKSDAVVIGLTNGTVVFFSPQHGRVVRMLSHSLSSSAINSVAIPETGHHLWTTGADGAIRLWDMRTDAMLGNWKSEDLIPYSAIAIRPHAEDGDEDEVEFLVANHSIRLLSADLEDLEAATNFEPQNPEQVAAFTGHASSVTRLQWDASQTPSKRFLSAAEADRFVYIWEVPDASSSEGHIVASIPLDSDARHIALASSSISKSQSLLTVSASGKISVFPVPSELAQSSPQKKKVPTLLSRSNVTFSAKKDALPVQVLNAVFANEGGQLRVVRLVGGVRPVFQTIKYLDDSGNFIEDVKFTIDDSNVGLPPDAAVPGAAPNKRYAEPDSVAVRSGGELGQDEEMDDLVAGQVDGALDAELAELSLGQRLAALSGGERPAIADDDADDADKGTGAPAVVPAHSLTRTLIQALHSSDAGLLETCLAHTDAGLIRNTVRRLPPQLAVPLLNACVERLGRGARAGRMKGRGGGASAQRGMGLVAWVRAVLVVHSGHLMTMPDLVAKLAGLHATLTARLTLQNSLLSLNGRLDMVLSQIEMRTSSGPTQLAMPRKEKTRAAAVPARKYVEGESSSDDEDEPMVEVESGDEGGSVEDVELGGDSDDEDEDSEFASDDEGQDDEDDSEGGPTLNGFIDDEAEEEYSDEDEEDSE